MKEIEVTYEVFNKENEVKDILKKAGCKPKGEYTMEDIYM